MALVLRTGCTGLQIHRMTDLQAALGLSQSRVCPLRMRPGKRAALVTSYRPAVAQTTGQVAFRTADPCGIYT